MDKETIKGIVQEAVLKALQEEKKVPIAASNRHIHYHQSMLNGFLDAATSLLN